MRNGDYKISVEKRLTCVETKLDEIMTNHLPHIQAKVDKIQWLLITNLITVIFMLAELLLR
jgi:hypothetical protein